MRTAFLCLTLALSTFVALPAASNPDSTLSIPLSIRLSTVAQALERALPNPVVQGQDVLTCVEAQQVCTKVPEFRGLKIYSRMQCVTITPRIDCSIDQLVERSGPVEVTGSGSTITLHQAFRGQATLRGRGEIGRHIRETATGAAVVTLHVTPRLGPDWRLVADSDHDIDWTQRPQADLFNVIPITFGTQAEQVLNRSVDDFRASGLQPALDRLAVRAKMEPLWARLQEPVAIPINDDLDAQLQFIPSSVALAPLAVNESAITTRLSVTGTFRLSDRLQQLEEPVPLPALSYSPEPEGVSIAVPVSLSFDTLAAIAQTQMPHILDLGTPLGISLEVSKIQIEEVGDDRLRFRLETRGSVTSLGLMDTQFPLSLTGRLVWSHEGQELQLEEPELQLDNPGLTAAAFNSLATSGLAVGLLADLVRIPLGEAIADLESGLILKLESAFGTAIQASGSASISLSDLHANDGLHAVFGLSGALALDILELK